MKYTICSICTVKNMNGGVVGHIVSFVMLLKHSNLMKQRGSIGSSFTNLPPLAALNVRTHGVLVRSLEIALPIALLVVRCVQSALGSHHSPSDRDVTSRMMKCKSS